MVITLAEARVGTELLVIDALGRVVGTHTLTGTRTSLRTDLPTGAYSALLLSDPRTLTARFTVIR